MSITAVHLRDHVVIPALDHLTSITGRQMNKLSAVNLLLGTCAQESAMGTYLVQLGGGPALGIYQMEPGTYNDVVTYIREWPALSRAFFILGYEVERVQAKKMIGDLDYATMIARVYYWRFPAPLPDHTDVRGLGNYWKKYWNTMLGRGTVTQFISHYERYIENGEG